MEARMRIALLPLVLLTACHFDLVTIEVESQESCVSDLHLKFPGGNAARVTATLTDSDPAQPSPLQWDLAEGWELTEVTLTGVGLQPRAGVTDLHFVDGLQVDVGGLLDYVELPEVTLIDVDQLPPDNSTGTTHLDPTKSHNLVQYLEADRMMFTLEVDGELPAQAWELDADVCFSLTAETSVAVDDVGE
jgi:hypothetical protein